MRTALRAERLDLALLEPADAEELHAILGDPASNTVGDGAYASLERTRGWIEHRRAVFERTGLVWYGLRLRGTGELIGVSGATPNRTGDEEPEIGYLVRASSRRRGYALEATAAALDELLLDRARVWATIRPANAPSIRIVERLGFRPDRTEVDRKGDLRYFVRDR